MKIKHAAWLLFWVGVALTTMYGTAYIGGEVLPEGWTLPENGYWWSVPTFIVLTIIGLGGTMSGVILAILHLLHLAKANN